MKLPESCLTRQRTPWLVSLSLRLRPQSPPASTTPKGLTTIGRCKRPPMRQLHLLHRCRTYHQRAPTAMRFGLRPGTTCKSVIHIVTHSPFFVRLLCPTGCRPLLPQRQSSPCPVHSSKDSCSFGRWSRGQPQAAYKKWVNPHEWNVSRWSIEGIFPSRHLSKLHVYLTFVGGAFVVRG